MAMASTTCAVKAELTALGVVDHNDLCGSQSPLGNYQRAKRVSGNSTTGISDHVGIADSQTQELLGVQPSVHASDYSHLALGRCWEVAM